ncbi:hypothetical protein NY2A_B117L [Paramecium bursaria Chlorella virus NY2A]|uniref:Uncharacterized protein B117L n=1 Tax=Paramecium bursaria Chlorella virus NY2A TaxID=46021 RepID=A7IVZ2_PBCVN|nr:hypothetical protein NY2A_B117L [Paramecium bursaria Chlorella virus NY2A]ABT14516.1 hypothetical protein NY2A_B117L [Paramecium bursaria Chlorella virus NY2A]
MIPEAIEFKQHVETFIKHMNEKMNSYCFSTEEEYDEIVDQEIWEYNQKNDSLMFEPAYDGQPETNIGNIKRMRHRKSLDKYGNVFYGEQPPRTHSLIIYNKNETLYAMVSTFFLADTRTYLYKIVYNKNGVPQPYFILHCIDFEEVSDWEDEPLYDADQEITYD